MALNASIFGNMLNAPKSPEEYLAERQNLQASKLANALNQQKADEYTKGIARQGELLNLLAGGADSGALRQAGFLGEAADWDKNAALVAKDRAAAAKDTNDANLKTWQAYRDQSSMIRNPQEAAAWITLGYNDPVIGPFLQRFGSLEEGVSRIPTDPAGFEQWRMGVGSNVDKMASHALQQQEFGLKQNQFGETVRHNKSTEGTAAGQLSVARQRLTLDQQAPKGQYDAERGVLVDPRTGEARPVTLDGQPLGAKDKPLNDSQSKALLFGSRMQAANKVLADLEKTGTSASVPGSRTPIIGGIISAAQGANQQSLDQAKRDFMTAILRRESGASISPTEFDTADQQYFPQIGDSKQVRAQKAANRQLAIDGVLVEVPEKQRGSLSKPPQQSGPKPGAVEDGHRFKGGDPSNPSNWEKVK